MLISLIKNNGVVSFQKDENKEYDQSILEKSILDLFNAGETHLIYSSEILSKDFAKNNALVVNFSQVPVTMVRTLPVPPPYNWNELLGGRSLEEVSKEETMQLLDGWWNGMTVNEEQKINLTIPYFFT